MQLRVFFAFLLSLAGFILSILILFSGSKPGFIEDGDLATFDRPDYGDYNNYGWQDFTDLRVSPDIPDWYSAYYLGVCWGNYDNNTGYEIDTKCARWLDRPNEIKRAFIPWTVGTALAGLSALLLPFFLRGRLHFNGFMFFSLLVSWAALSLGGVLGSLYTAIEYSSTSRGRLLLPMTWAAAGCIFFAMLIETFEHGLQRFTPHGEVISSKYKPANVSWVGYNRRMLVSELRHDARDIGNGLGNL